MYFSMITDVRMKLSMIFMGMLCPEKEFLFDFI